VSRNKPNKKAKVINIETKMCPILVARKRLLDFKKKTDAWEMRVEICDRGVDAYNKNIKIQNKKADEWDEQAFNKQDQETLANRSKELRVSKMCLEAESKRLDDEMENLNLENKCLEEEWEQIKKANKAILKKKDILKFCEDFHRKSSNHDPDFDHCRMCEHKVT
jgi:hypothetical protein